MMMDRSEVKRIVDEHLRFMLWDMQLNMWRATVEYDRADDHKAAASLDWDANIIHFYIDPDLAEDEADVLHSLRHELLHQFFTPFNLLYDMASRLATTEAERDTVKALWDHAHERGVAMLEDMLDHGYRLPLGKRPDYVAPQNVSPYEVSGDGAAQDADAPAAN
jgi:hypothetical protein